jgi:hypothetical protein
MQVRPLKLWAFACRKGILPVQQTVQKRCTLTLHLTPLSLFKQLKCFSCNAKHKRVALRTIIVLSKCRTSQTVSANKRNNRGSDEIQDRLLCNKNHHRYRPLWSYFAPSCQESQYTLQHRRQKSGGARPNETAGRVLITGTNIALVDMIDKLLNGTVSELRFTALNVVRSWLRTDCGGFLSIRAKCDHQKQIRLAFETRTALSPGEWRDSLSSSVFSLKASSLSQGSS